jgi:ABC-type multidrug transport system fused ATPase/permease subunit
VRALLGSRRRLVAALAVASVLTGLAESAILTVVAQVAAALADNRTRVHAAVGPLHLNVTISTLLVAAFVLAVLRLVLQLPMSVLPAQIAADVQASLRRALFSAFTRASWAEQSRDREGHLQELMTNQIGAASAGALQAMGLVTGLFTLLVLLASAFLLNVVAALVVLTAAVLLFSLLRPLTLLGSTRARALSQAQMNFAHGVGEATRLAEETQVFGAADAQRARVGGLVDTSRELYVRTQAIARLAPNIYQSMIYLILVGGLAVLSASGAGDLASLGAVVLLLVRAGSYGQQAQGAYQYVRQAFPYLDRVRDAQRRYLASEPHSGKEPLDAVRELALENVAYMYTPGRPVLSEISFEVAGGEAIGVVGPSGAGKSTLVQILLQLRTPDEGRYLVNGRSVESYVRADWQARVAYVAQEPRLLHASVAENIRYFRPLDDASVERAARLARIHDDIVGWADGYDTVVGPRADAVSGGQQQRLSIARALAGRPSILVLDEPTSALDPESEHLLQASLLSLKGELTLFVVAHRMSTLEICDRVMVILAGRLAGFDAAERLKRDNAYYRTALALASGSGAPSVA